MAEMTKALAFKILEELFRSLGNIERIKSNIKLSDEEFDGENKAVEEIQGLIAEISEKYI